MKVLYVFTLAFIANLCQEVTGKRKCTAEEEEFIVYKCGANDMLDLATKYSYVAGVMGHIVYDMIQPDGARDVVLADYKQTDWHLSGSPDDACDKFRKYDYCTKEHIMERCYSRLNGFVTFFWSYACEPDTGFKDLSACGNCLVNEGVADSLMLQLTHPTCQQRVAEYYDAVGVLVHNSSQPAMINMWCAMRRASVDCFEPAFGNVCGLHASAFIAGLYSALGDLLKKVIRPSTPITCPRAPEYMTEKAMRWTHGDETNIRYNSDGVDAISDGDHVRSRLEGKALHLVRDTPRDDKLVMNLAVSILGRVLGNSEFDDLINQLKRDENFIRQHLPICAAMDQLYKYGICFLESIPSHSGQPPSFIDLEKMIVDYCTSGQPERLHACAEQQMSACPKGYVQYEDLNIKATCDAHMAVNRDIAAGCYWPSISGLEIKSKCNISLSELLELFYKIYYNMDDHHELLKVAKRIIPLAMCADLEIGRLNLSRLPPGCTEDTRQKVKAMCDASEKMVDYGFYDFLVEYVHDEDIVRNLTASTGAALIPSN